MLHAHFDCFSGAAGDMMLASCLDASSDDQLLKRIENDLKNGIPEIADEFKITMKKVLRGGMGGISAKKVDVISVYNHAPAPLPKDNFSHDHTHSHEHSQSHSDHDLDSSDKEGHSHGHSQSHSDHTSYSSDIDNHLHNHSHSHGHNHSHSDHTSYSSDIEGHPHNHSHSHGHNHSHSDHSSDIEGHSYNHSHSHSHNHSHSDHTSYSSDIDNHSHKHSHVHGHYHNHSDRKGPLRNLPQIRKLLLESSRDFIPLKVCDLAIKVFTELAKAESFTHGATDEDTVYFHEVGAIDSIVDVVGTLLALNHLCVSTVSCSALPLGEGTVWTDHGQLPVPAFATMRLLIGMPTCKGPGEKSGTITGELVTPTAAALLRVLTGVADAENMKNTSISSETRVGRAPNFTPRFIGLGAGSKDFMKHPNVIRLIIGDNIVHDDKLNGHHATESLMHALEAPSNFVLSEAKRIDDSSAVLETPSNNSVAPSLYIINSLTRLEANLDDITAEVLANVIDLLLENGAIDAWVQPIVMKKGRSAHTLSCLFHSGSELESVLMNIIFRHTTTLGIRIHRDLERAALNRKVVQVETQYGNIDVKLGLLGNEVVSIKSEFEQCKAISRKVNVPIHTIAERASRSAIALLDLNDTS